MKLWELLDREDESPISRAEFREMLDRCRAEFEAAQPSKRRRGGRRRPVAPAEPAFEAAPGLDILEELR